jgi:hypothetical protein
MSVAAPDLSALHSEHPMSAHAASTLPLDGPRISQLLRTWPDPRAFAAQATPRELGRYGFPGEPAYGNGAGPHSADDPEDVLVFHGQWTAAQVNMHAIGLGAHVRWLFVDAITGQAVGGGYADCSTE